MSNEGTDDDIDHLFRSFQETDLSLEFLDPPLKRAITTMTYSITLANCDCIERLDIDLLSSVHSIFTVERSKFSAYAAKLVAKERFPCISVKLFPKGSVHITGCKSANDAIRVSRAICDLLESAYPGTSPRPLTYTLNMINIGLTCPFTIHLTRFADACRAHGGYAEQPEKPPSCIVRRKATVLVYKSGKMVVTGKSPESCAEAYAFVMKVLDAHEETYVNALRKEKAPARAARFLRDDTTSTAAYAP